jgi:hypothetical protein
MSEEMAAIDQSTLCAIEDRKRAAEMLVTIARQVAGSFAVFVGHCWSLFAEAPHDVCSWTTPWTLWPRG